MKFCRFTMTSGPGCWERETSPGRFSTTAPGNRLPGGLNFAPAGYPNIKCAESLEVVLGASGVWPTRLDGSLRRHAHGFATLKRGRESAGAVTRSNAQWIEELRSWPRPDLSHRHRSCVRIYGLYAEVGGEHASRAPTDPIESALATVRFRPTKTRGTSARQIANNDRLYLEGRYLICIR